MLPILIPRIHDQKFHGNRSPLLGGLQLSKEAEILRSSLIWCVVPMIQISSKSQVFEFSWVSSAPWMWPDPEITPARIIPRPGQFFWHINRPDPPSRWHVKPGQTNQPNNRDIEFYYIEDIWYLELFISVSYHLVVVAFSTSIFFFLDIIIIIIIIPLLQKKDKFIM